MRTLGYIFQRKQAPTAKLLGGLVLSMVVIAAIAAAVALGSSSPLAAEEYMDPPPIDYQDPGPGGIPGGWGCWQDHRSCYWDDFRQTWCCNVYMRCYDGWAYWYSTC